MTMSHSRVVKWLCAAGFLLSLAGLQSRLEYRWKPDQRIQQFMYLPDGEYLRIASLGYKELLADLLWIQAIQVVGERKVSDEAGRWLYRAFDVITTLDPHFVRVYEAGGLVLTTLVVLPEESNRLLSKGMRYNKTEWKLPFLLGFNYYFEFDDDAKAAQYIAEASRLPGAPPGLVAMAANLFLSAKSPEQAIELLAAAYQNTKDDNAKRLLELRLRIMITERDLQALEQAIERYRAMHKRVPAQLDDLVLSGLIRALPPEPSGGRYVYDPRTGSVASSELPERPKLIAKRRMR